MEGFIKKISAIEVKEHTKRLFEFLLTRPALSAFIAVLTLASIATAGSLTPPASPASTFNTLEEIYDSIASDSFDSSGFTASTSGSLINHLLYIEQNLGWASASPDIYTLNSGNVGIGDSTPEAKFEVVGTASVSGTLFANGGCVGCGGGVSSNSLDFDEFVDAMTLDADTTIASGGFSLDFDNGLFHIGDNVGIASSSPNALFVVANELGGSMIKVGSTAEEVPTSSGAGSGRTRFSVNGNGGHPIAILNDAGVTDGYGIHINATLALGSEELNLFRGGLDRNSAATAIGLYSGTSHDIVFQPGRGVSASNVYAGIIDQATGYWGIGSSVSPNTILDIQGTASASRGIFSNEVNIALGDGASVAYSRFGTGTTDHLLTAADDLLISGVLELDDQLFVDSNASISGTLEITLDGTVSSASHMKLTDSSSSSEFGLVNNNGTFNLVASPSSQGYVALSVASQSGGVDIGAPARPTFKGHIAGSGAPNFLGFVNDVFVSGRYAYGVGGTDNSLTIVDISNPSSPSFVGNIAGGSNFLTGANHVFVSGHYAYVTTVTDDGLTIIDVSDPTNPTFVAESVDLADPNWVYVSGKYAYVTATTGGDMTVLDISNPENPKIVGDVAISGGPRAVYVAGRYAYVVTGGTPSGLSIIDISDPANPTETGRITGSGAPNFLALASDVYVSGRYAYVAAYTDDSLTIIDVSDPTSPTFVGNISGASNFLDGINTLAVSGRYAYVSAQVSDAISIIDVSNPTTPAFVGHIAGSGAPNFLNLPQSVQVVGKYAYVAAFLDNSLTIIDLGGLETPTLYAGDIVTSDVEILDNLSIGNDLYVSNGALIGGGLMVNGRFGVSVASLSDNVASISSAELFSVRHGSGRLSGDGLAVSLAESGAQEDFTGSFARFSLADSDLVIIESSGAILASGAAQFGSAGVPSSVTYSRFGTGTTDHLLTAADDLLITGLVEFDDTVFFDGGIGSGASVSGNWDPSADDTYDLGDSSNRWRDLYLGPGSLYIGTTGDEASISFDMTRDELSFRVKGSNLFTITSNSIFELGSRSEEEVILRLGNETDVSAADIHLDFRRRSTGVDSFTRLYTTGVEIWRFGADNDGSNHFYFQETSGVNVVTIEDGSRENSLFIANINGDGVVGIGKANPTTTLDVEGSASVSGNFEISGTVSSDLIPTVDDAQDLGSTSLRWRDLYLGPSTIYLGEDGDEASISYNTVENRLRFLVGGTASASIDSDGNFYVGSQPAATGGTGKITLREGSTKQFSITSDDTGVYYQSNSTTPLYFQSGGGGSSTFGTPVIATTLKALSLTASTSGTSFTSDTNRTVMNLSGARPYVIDNQGVFGNTFIVSTRMAVGEDLDFSDSPTATLEIDGDTSTLFTVASGSTDILTVFEAGTASLAGDFEVTGYASVSQLFGLGLTDCDTGATSKLLWSDTGIFSCGTDQTAAGSGVTSDSLDFDEFVDGIMTLDGSLTIASAGGTVTWEPHFANNLTPATTDTYGLGSDSLRWSSLFLSSGSLHIGSVANDSIIDFDTTSYASDALAFYPDSTMDPTVTFFDDGYVGINTTAPAVVSSISDAEQAFELYHTELVLTGENANESDESFGFSTDGGTLYISATDIGSNTIAQLNSDGDFALRGALQVGSYEAANVAYSRLGTDTALSNDLTSSEDLLVSGDLEVHGTISFGGSGGGAGGNLYIDTDVQRVIHIKSSDGDGTQMMWENTSLAADQAWSIYTVGNVGDTSLGTEEGAFAFVDSTDDVTRMTLTREGRLGIASGSPIETLSVVGNGRFDGQLGVGNFGGVDQTDWYGNTSSSSLTIYQYHDSNPSPAVDFLSGINSIVELSGATTDTFGISSQVIADSSGTPATLNAMYANPVINDNATEASGLWVYTSMDGREVSSSYGVFVTLPEFNNGTIDEVYGLYIDDYGNGTDPVSTGSVSATFNLYMAGEYPSYSAGRLGIGTDDPVHELHISSGSEGFVMRLEDSDGTCDLDPDSGGLTTFCSSDIRLKSDIDDAPSIMAELMQLKIREYTVDASGNRTIGVIAQEVQETHPEFVSENNEGILMVRQPGVWELVKGIQELQEQLDILALPMPVSELQEGTASDILSIDDDEEGLFGRFITQLSMIVVEVRHLIADVITADRIETNELCVGETCVTEDELIELLERTGIEPNEQTPSGAGGEEPSDSDEETDDESVSAEDDEETGEDTSSSEEEELTEDDDENTSIEELDQSDGSEDKEEGEEVSENEESAQEEDSDEAPGETPDEI